MASCTFYRRLRQIDSDRAGKRYLISFIALLFSGSSKARFSRGLVRARSALTSPSNPGSGFASRRLSRSQAPRSLHPFFLMLPGSGSRGRRRRRATSKHPRRRVCLVARARRRAQSVASVQAHSREPVTSPRSEAVAQVHAHRKEGGAQPPVETEGI